MWMMDRFFDGEFFSYGWRVMNLSDTPQEQRYDPMVSKFIQISVLLILTKRISCWSNTTTHNGMLKQINHLKCSLQVYVFPRITKCIFHKYGASGSIQKHDSLCVLPLNIVNEKTYIFIWFWFIILLILLIGLVIYRYVHCRSANRLWLFFSFNLII